MTDLAAFQRHDMAIELLRLANEQGEALRNERLEQFLYLMDRRDEIVGEMLAAIGTPAPDNVVPFPSLGRQAADGNVEETTRALLTAVLQQDERNERLLQVQMGHIRNALSSLGQGFRAARGYAAAMPRDYYSERLDIAY